MSFLNFNCEDIKNHKAQSGYNLKYLLLDNVNAGFKQSIKIKLSDYIKRPLDCSYDYCKIVKAGTTDAYTKVTQIDSKSYNLITSLLYAHKPDQFQLACKSKDLQGNREDEVFAYSAKFTIQVDIDCFTPAKYYLVGLSGNKFFSNYLSSKNNPLDIYHYSGVNDIKTFDLNIDEFIHVPDPSCGFIRCDWQRKSTEPNYASIVQLSG